MKLIYAYEKPDHNTEYFISAVKPYVSEVIPARQDAGYANIVEAYLQTLKQLTAASGQLFSEDVLLASDRIWGPLRDIGDLLDKTTDEKDIIALYYQEAYLDTFQADQPHKIRSCYAGMDFCFLSKRVIGELDFSKLLQEVKGADEETSQAVCYQYWKEKGYQIDYFYDFGKYFFAQPVWNFDIGKFLPYELMTEYDFPFLMKKSVIYNRNEYMDYTDYMSFPKAVQYISQHATYDETIIIRYLIDHYNAGDIADMLNAQYILPDDAPPRLPNGVAHSAVFMHLYYKDLLDVYLPYINNIPPEMDVYISTEVENWDQIDSYMAQIGRDNYKLVEKQNRGRDLSALLVAFRPYYDRYQYICFIHDKKTMGGKGPSLYGKQFSQLMWDNLLHGKEYIYRVIGLLEQNELLGFLSPPKPYHKAYFKFYYNVWVDDYENTQKLLNQLGIPETYIEKTKQPFALSTSFWCRPEVLKPLMDLEWDYADFPEEPMDTDGTISHALERVFPYVAQSCGYYSGIVMNALYSSELMLNHEKRLGAVSEHIIRDIPYELDIGYDRLIAFLKLVQWNMKNPQKRYYIYGCGKGGKDVYHKLEQQGIKVEGFITSDGYEKDSDTLFGENVYYLSEIENKKDIFVFIGVCFEYYDEVVMNLEEAGIYEYY